MLDLIGSIGFLEDLERLYISSSNAVKAYLYQWENATKVYYTFYLQLALIAFEVTCMDYVEYKVAYKIVGLEIRTPVVRAILKVAGKDFARFMLSCTHWSAREEINEFFEKVYKNPEKVMKYENYLAEVVSNPKAALEFSGDIVKMLQEKVNSVWEIMEKLRGIAEKIHAGFKR